MVPHRDTWAIWATTPGPFPRQSPAEILRPLHTGMSATGARLYLRGTTQYLGRNSANHNRSRLPPTVLTGRAIPPVVEEAFFSHSAAGQRPQRRYPAWGRQPFAGQRLVQRPQRHCTTYAQPAVREPAAPTALHTVRAGSRSRARGPNGTAQCMRRPPLAGQRPQRHCTMYAQAAVRGQPAPTVAHCVRRQPFAGQRPQRHCTMYAQAAVRWPAAPTALHNVCAGSRSRASGPNGTAPCVCR